MNWNIVNLDSVTDLISSGSTPLGGSDNYLAAGAVMFIRSQNVHMNTLVLDDVVYISDEIHKKMKRTWVHPGDVLLNITGASIGRVSSFDLENIKANVNQHVCIIRPKPDILFTRYLSYFLSTPQFQSHIDEMQRGGTRQALTFTQIANFEIPLPPLAEQQRIAAILDKADTLRTKHRAALAKLDTLLQATFLHMFGDPVTNPMGWEVKPLEMVLSREPQNGAYYPKESYTDNQDLGIEMVHMSDAFHDTVNRGNLKRVIITEFDVKKYGLGGNDILIARRSLNYEGSAKPCLIPQSTEPLIFESSLIRITPDLEQLSTSYLYHYLANERVRQNFVFPNVTRSTISGINQAGLKRIKVIVPKRTIQAAFEDILAKIEISRRQMTNQEEDLDTLFHSLQQRAFKGEL